MRRPRTDLPHIPGYAVQQGRTWLHARYWGTYEQAQQLGRPWHVVAPTPAQLVKAVRHG